MKQEKVVRLAKIDNDEIIPYDLCSEIMIFYGRKYYDFIGMGRIYSINGVHQASSTDYYFYVKKDKNKNKEKIK